MGFLETIGLLTVIFIAIVLASEFMKSVEKTKAMYEKSDVEMKQFLADDATRKLAEEEKIAAQKKWEQENPEEAKLIAEDKLRVERNNDAYYERQRKAKVLGQAFSNGKWSSMGLDEKVDLLRQLSELDPDKWREFYLESQEQYEEIKNKNNMAGGQ